MRPGGWLAVGWALVLTVAYVLAAQYLSRKLDEDAASLWQATVQRTEADLRAEVVQAAFDRARR